jgi:drug/metabolite transporter (DMT)-like permease
MWTVTVYSLGAASMFWLIVLPPTPHRLDSINGGLWGILAGFAFISILIPHSLFFGGLRHVVASRAVIISTFEPIVAIVSASMIVGEILGPLQIGGAILVITSIVFLELRRESPQISEVATTHTETPNVAQ